jgi:hypothetical protein
VVSPQYPRRVRAIVSDLVFYELRKQVGKWWEGKKAEAGAITAAGERRERSARRASAKAAIGFLCFVSAKRQAKKSKLQKRPKIYRGHLADTWRTSRGHLTDNRKNATRRQLWTTAKRPLSFPTVTPRQNQKQV